MIYCLASYCETLLKSRHLLIPTSDYEAFNLIIKQTGKSECSVDFETFVTQLSFFCSYSTLRFFFPSLSCFAAELQFL